MKILTVAHNDPRLHPGGTEILAWGLHQSFDGMAGVESFFLGATADIHRRQRPGTAFQTIGRSSNAQLIWAGHFNSFEHLQTDTLGVFTEFIELLTEFAPDVVHFHHTQLIGTDALAVVRRHRPSAALVMTLHDYYPICHADGTMVKTTGPLCRAASSGDCAKCFPEIDPAAFKVRELAQKTLLGLCDLLIAPSEFLRDRYVAWGLPAEKIRVLRNGRPAVPPARVRALKPGGRRNRFATFGNISKAKGTLLAVEAVRRLDQAGVPATLDLFGDPLFQGEEYQERFRAALEAAGPAVRHHGRYEADEVPRLMAGVDWVIVPSLWWENAPLVIEEAFAHGRPVICSDIGGMAERVRDDVDGLHFRMGDAADLTDALERAVEEEGLHERLAAGIAPVRTLATCAADHLDLYRSLTGQAEPHRPPPSPPAAPPRQADPRRSGGLTPPIPTRAGDRPARYRDKRLLSNVGNPDHQDIITRDEYQPFLADETLPIPGPEALRRVGSFERLDFLQVGVIILDNLRSAAGLRPDQAVLDVGCGWGRLALPLTRHLGPQGRYVGVDVAPGAIGWCRAEITARHPNFTFHHIDAANSYANPAGAVPAEEIRLLDGALDGRGRFDLIAATSLFTHMLPAATENYLAQMAALCRPGGILYATFFLLDEEAERLIAEGRSRHSFPAEHEGVRISNPAVPEDAVAYRPDWLLGRLAAHGFEAEIRKGFWSGRPEGGFDYQDVVIARRVAE